MLEKKAVPVRETRQARSQPLTDRDVRDLLKGVESVLIVRGKKLIEIPASETGPEDLRGPTGNIRAPLVKVGKKLLVGFRPEALKSLVGF